MSLINVLDRNTINRIAAGEVIERPASVVKELIENSIDAGATAVTCEISGGGIELIRVTDNGSGISTDDIRTAFVRHATSKIKDADDLESVLSFGFRGEALASIAAVARVELVTKTRDSFTGIRYVTEAGEEISFEEIGCPDGTTFIVHDLFANVPVRRKFLKTPTTEAAYVVEAVERIALSHPAVSIKLISNGKTAVFTNGSNSLRSVIYGIYGRDIASELLEVSTERNGICVSGFIASPSVARSNRNTETYYVNGRFIRSAVINRAAEDAYSGYLMQHKYPFTAIVIDIPSSAMDVNVHPTKQEVRFEDNDSVYDAVYHAVRDALDRKTLIPDMAPGAKELSESKAILKSELSSHKLEPEPYETVRRTAPAEVNVAQASHAVYEEHSHALHTAPVYEAAAPGIVADQPKTGKQLILDMEHPDSVVIREETRDDFKKGLNDGYTIVGQLFDTYWVVTKGEQLYILDQHAAHEKIIYEYYSKKAAGEKPEIQYISPPLIITLSPSECLCVDSHTEELASLGYTVENFGGREYCVSSAPLQVFGLDERDLLLEIIDSFSRPGTECGSAVSLNDRLATCSCKAAVKGNNRLSMQEAQELIKELLKLDNPFNCPHGRPVMISMTKQELEKKFKRII